MPEQWKTMPGFPGYDVSDQGNVKTYWYRRGRTWHLAETPQAFVMPHLADGYYRVSLHDGVKRRGHSISRLVLMAFVGPQPEGMEACHNDSVKWNNRLENLRWDTHGGNMADKRTAPKGPKISPFQKMLRRRWKDIEFDLTHLFMEFVTEDWIGSPDNA